jgi:hypothetical protein
MRIEFQYNFDEWLEWKRASVLALRLAVLQVAEILLIPLSFLLGLGLIMVSLRFLNLATPITGRVPVWLPILILILIAISQIYLSTIPTLRTRVLKKEWQNQMANLEYKLDVTEQGFDSISENLTRKTPWKEISSVFQTKRLLIFCELDNQVLLIPKRAFPSKEQLDEFLELAHQKTVSERNDAARGPAAA